MGDVVPEGERLIKAWLYAQTEIERIKRDLNRAECDERNAQAALAKWLMPSDMKPDEKIAIWFSDSLIQVELAPREAYQVGGEGDGKVIIDHVPKVTVRSRGKDLRRMQLTG